MTDVFLSYSRKDRPHAEKIAAALDEDFKLWWDKELKSGAAFVQEINTKLAEAKCIVVLWSDDSLKSPWVVAEAIKGFDSRRLVQLGFKVVELVPFNILHCTVLKGEPSQADIDELKDAIRSTINRSVEAPPTASRDDSAAPAKPIQPSAEQQAKAVREMDANRFANLFMGFSAASLLLAVLLVTLGAALMVLNVIPQSPLPTEYTQQSLIGAAVLCGIGVLIMLRNTISFIRTGG